MPNRSRKVCGPAHEGKYPDRNIDCQAALADRVVDLIEEAENAGWSAIRTNVEKALARR
ncbi:hypothetical protein [Brucella pituitosa]|uniref:hypothetical protein n=1 Tax=Brucella pituitosa TaxID=571256 RepID=UPI003F4AE005